MRGYFRSRKATKRKQNDRWRFTCCCCCFFFSISFGFSIGFFFGLIVEFGFLILCFWIIRSSNWIKRVYQVDLARSVRISRWYCEIWMISTDIRSRWALKLFCFSTWILGSFLLSLVCPVWSVTRLLTNPICDEAIFAFPPNWLMRKTYIFTNKLRKLNPRLSEKKNVFVNICQRWINFNKQFFIF